MISLYKAINYPILQNRVYSKIEESINTPLVDIDISIDENGFICNKLFDNSKMYYDENYDNLVPSEFHKNYYSKIIKFLDESYLNHSNPVILDIGCGKGNFLMQTIEELDKNVKGIGIDPSYEGALMLNEGRLLFIREYFNKEHLNNIDNISLIILRHTLEHIENPTSFLKQLFQLFDSNKYKNIPIFIEVPDVDWIFDNKCYWDFFYEHVNYFSKYSLFNCIKEAGGYVESIKNEFGDQYLWAQAIINHEIENKNNPFILKDYSNSVFNELIERYNNKIKKNSEASEIVIWGMASKGIIYSLIANNLNTKIDYYVDVNLNKQEKYIPKIGKKIVSPENLPKDKKLSIICMNPNYTEEIRLKCENLKLDFELYNPEIDKI